MAYALLAWMFALAALMLAYRQHLARSWREPVLRMPVLILESDDWGAGPPEQALALKRLADILGNVRDAGGRPAMMTLGVVLAMLDRNAWRNSQTYAARSLAAGEHGEILAAMRAGIAARVFAPQLHGMEHYWPDALLRAAATDENVRDWLGKEGAPTESLPDALQSRWIDGSQLPSRALPPEQIRLAVAEEVQLFQTLFGMPPAVAVPNTFVWNDEVERAWAGQGVRYVVTPGTRYEARDANGALVSSGRAIANGDVSESALRYLVRDVYFEPARGHQAAQLVRGLTERAHLGRPCLVETHRFNYLGAEAERSFPALRDALQQAQRAVPNVRFMSTTELGDAMSAQDPAVVETRLPARFALWVARVFTASRFRKLAWVSGLALLLHGARLCALSITRPKVSTP